ncbi:MAG: hypothetical protein NTV88_02650 [Candidatus Micrarchaeota archaeon]|nr:hypothetical protein [Candidatus Micrarchaeota archaeon]
MSRLVNLSDSIYEELTRMKRTKRQSYSEVVGELLKNRGQKEKTESLKELIAWAEEKARRYRGPKEKTDHDLIAHGVSRDDS